MKPIDRDRLRAFVAFAWQRLREDRLLETAGALAYTTVFALVPALATALGIMAMFPAWGHWSSTVSGFVFRNLMPAAGNAVEQVLLRFAANASRMTAIGVVAVLLSGLLMMAAIEERFNRIWRVSHRRRGVLRFLTYWAALTLGPLLVVGGLAVSSYLLALPWLAQANRQLGVGRYLLDLAPFLITWIGLLGMYLLIPARRVALRHALGGALLAALAFSAARYGFALYALHATSYRILYGALAAVPIFLVWVYVSWAIVLAGASLTAAFAAFQYVPQAQRLPPGTEFVGLLLLLAVLADAQQRGAGMDNAALRRALPFLTEDTLTRYLEDLERARLLRRSDLGDWLLTRSLHGVRLADLYAAGHYRLPASSALLGSAAQSLPAPLAAQVAALGQALEAGLGADLASLYAATDTSRIPPHDAAP